MGDQIAERLARLSTQVTQATRATIICATLSLVLSTIYGVLTATGDSMLPPPLNVALYTMMGLITGMAWVAWRVGLLRLDQVRDRQATQIELAQIRSENAKIVETLARLVAQVEELGERTRPIIVPPVLRATGTVHLSATAPAAGPIFANGVEYGLNAQPAKVVPIDRNGSNR